MKDENKKISKKLTVVHIQNDLTLEYTIHVLNLFKSYLISLRISGLDDLASVELPTVVEGLQRTKCCQRGDRR